MSFTPIANVGEFGLIDRLKDVLGKESDEKVLIGIGDDAAAVSIDERRIQVITTDALVEGVHFDRTFIPMRYLGRKALAVNVSDIVAMNARPHVATVAIGVPNDVSVEQMEALYGGIAEAAAEYGVTVVGGDTTAAQRMFISITVTGEVAPERLTRRSGAQPGDLLCVTGDLGASAAGLKLLLEGKSHAFQDDDAGATPAAASGDGAPAETGPDLRAYAHLVERHLAPKARMDILAHWSELDLLPTSLIDISDGLASEVHHICKSSNVGAVVEAGLLPIHVQTFQAAERYAENAASYALFGGEDYELLFTMAESETTKLNPNSFAVVGHIVDAEEGVLLRGPDGSTEPLPEGGFSHL
ncbi:thiamine-phosphate kinase [soil metagenome]